MVRATVLIATLAVASSAWAQGPPPAADATGARNVLTLEMALAILIEATLSFLGLGIQPPTPTWGNLIAEGRNFMFFKPYLVTIPGLALLVLAIAINMMGDGVRDITAPEGRN